MSINQLNAQIYEVVTQNLRLSLNEQYNDLEHHKYKVNLEQLRNSILDAPARGKTTELNRVTLDIMLPNGELREVQIEDSPIFSAKWAQQNPKIKTYKVRNTKGDWLSGRICVTPNGLSGTLFMEGATFFIETLENGEHISYKMHRSFVEKMSCQMTEQIMDLDEPTSSPITKRSNGDQLREYTIAIAASEEFSDRYNNNINDIKAQIVIHLNDVNALYEEEFSIQFILYDDTNNDLIFLNTTANDDDGMDPGVNHNDGGRADDAQAAIAGALNDPTAYDLGHVFHWIPGVGNNSARSSGLAGLGVVCQNGLKARGWTGAGTGAGGESLLNGIFLGTFGHEIGHQFNVPHTAYGVSGNCNPGNRSPGTSYEPGSGNSIMSYEGTCGASGSCTNHNITPEASTIYFHVKSMERLLDYIAVNNCSSDVASTNNLPDITTMPIATTIPKGTAFTLTGVATDGDGGDVLFYNWEECDTDNLVLSCPDGHPNDAATSTTAPLFRSFDPSETGATRHFPQMSDILNNTQTRGEILPQVGRDMDFRLTVRDKHNNGGGLDWEEVTITVDPTTGPFIVNTGNTPLGWMAGSNQTIEWEVAGTDGSPINCTNVKISISFDNGADNFSTVIAASTPNDGSYDYTVPNNLTEEAKIKIECTDNIFFDINNEPIAIIDNCDTEGGTIIDASPVSADAGDAALNLDLSAGKMFTMFNGTITSTDPPTRLAADNAGSCASFSNQPLYQKTEFIVTTSGSYTFTENTGSKYYTLYENSFDPESACTNWLNSTAELAGGITDKGNFTENLVIGTTYILVAHGVGNGSTGTYGVTINGAGNLFSISDLLNPGYDYTYVVVDNNNNNIVEITSDSDLTTVNAGSYTVHGLAYLGGTDLSSYINGTFATFQTALANETICGALSSNTVSVTINGSGVPVVYSNLYGAQINNGILINWETSSEVDNDYFILEYAEDGKNFNKLARVQGQGNTARLSNYDYLHTTPQVGLNYYRLQQVDVNGKVTISKIIVVNYLDITKTQLYPNPIEANNFTLNYKASTEGMIQIEILDLAGKVLINNTLEVTKGLNTPQITLPQLSAGTYFCRVTHNGKIETLRFVKM